MPPSGCCSTVGDRPSYRHESCKFGARTKVFNKKGKTPVLAADEARTLLDSIDTNTHIGLRDCALIGLMVYTFARVGAAFGMRVEDVYVQGRRTWVRWHEKGGKRHEMPCHHNLDEYLHTYINGAELTETKSVLFPTTLGRTAQLSDRSMRLFCNLTRSYILFLMTEYERLRKTETSAKFVSQWP